MNSETNERRERPRIGVIAELEDITYCILRRHGVIGGPGRDAVAARADHGMNQEGNTTMANLTIMIRNDQPKREQTYPPRWLLYKGEDTIEIHVNHDSRNRPFVLNTGAA